MMMRRISSQILRKQLSGLTCCCSCSEVSSRELSVRATMATRLDRPSGNVVRTLGRYPAAAFRTSAVIGQAKVIPESDPDKGKLVYVGTLSSMIKMVKAFSLSTSAIGLAAQPFIFQQAHEWPLFAKAAVGGCLSMFILVSPVLLHLITKRYITQLYYDKWSKNFTATTMTFFLQAEETKFKVDDVVRPAVSGLFTTVYIKGKPMFLEPTLFSDREVAIRLMGYDQPLDWELPQDEHIAKGKKDET